VNLSDEYFRQQLTTVFDPFRQERTPVLQTSANRVLDSFAIEIAGAAVYRGRHRRTLPR